MRMLWLLPLVISGSAGGCDAVLGCSDQTVRYTIHYKSPAEEQERRDLLEARLDGWSCFEDGTLRDASGHVVGERWRCSKCD